MTLLRLLLLLQLLPELDAAVLSAMMLLLLQVLGLWCCSCCCPLHEQLNLDLGLFPSDIISSSARPEGRLGLLKGLRLLLLWLAPLLIVPSLMPHPPLAAAAAVLCAPLPDEGLRASLLLLLLRTEASGTVRLSMNTACFFLAPWLLLPVQSELVLLLVLHSLLLRQAALVEVNAAAAAAAADDDDVDVDTWRLPSSRKKLLCRQVLQEASSVLLVAAVGARSVEVALAARLQDAPLAVFRMPGLLAWLTAVLLLLLLLLLGELQVQVTACGEVAKGILLSELAASLFQY
jgi:hypothetical protein